MDLSDALFKEIMVGMLNGIAIGVIVAIVAIAAGSVVAAVAAVAVVATVVVAGKPLSSTKV